MLLNIILCKESISIEEVIFIINILDKIKSKNKISLNEFLNIKDIPKEKNYLTTLDGEIILFIKVNPINVDLLSEEELETKMDLMSLEFSNEQNPYKILVIPRTVDISEHIHEQEELEKTCNDDISTKIIEQRIKFTSNLVADKNIIENEFYLLVWVKNSEDFETEINKRANTWITRFRNCELDAEILKEKDIILLVKSFTIPEFARKEGTNYGDNIVKLRERRKIA